MFLHQLLLCPLFNHIYILYSILFEINLLSNSFYNNNIMITSFRIWTFGNSNHLYKRLPQTTDEFQSVYICAPDDLCTPLFSFTPITRLWQLRKMHVNLSKLFCDTGRPGAPLWPHRPFKPDNLIWKASFSKLSHGSVASQWLGLFIPSFPWWFVCVCACVCWVLRRHHKPDQCQQTKKSQLGINEGLVSVRWAPRPGRDHLTQRMLWT